MPRANALSSETQQTWNPDAYNSHDLRPALIGCFVLSIIGARYPSAPTVNICVCSTGCNGGRLKEKSGETKSQKNSTGKSTSVRGSEINTSEYG